MKCYYRVAIVEKGDPITIEFSWKDSCFDTAHKIVTFGNFEMNTSDLHNGVLSITLDGFDEVRKKSLKDINGYIETVGGNERL